MVIAAMSLGELRELVMDGEASHAVVHGVAKSRTRLSYWTELKITADGDCSHEIKRRSSWKKSYDQPSQHIKKQRHYFAINFPSSQAYGFSSGHVWMSELDHKETWL